MDVFRVCHKRRRPASDDTQLKEADRSSSSDSPGDEDDADESATSTEDFEGNEEAPKAEHVYVNLLLDSWLEIKDPNFYRAIVAELLATLIIVYFSNMGILAGINAFEGCCGGGLHTFLLVYFFLLIITTIYAFAPLSGAHFNPAITFTLLLCRRVTPVRAAAYILAQLSGAIAGAGFTYLSVPAQLRGNLTTPSLNPLASAGEGIATEFFITFGLVFGTFATAFDPRGWGHLGPFWIGTIVAVNAHAGGFISSAAMNPARAFGCAVISGQWDHQYVYWVGDMVGGALGGLIYEWLFMFRTHARVKGVPSTSGDNHIHKYKKQS